MRFLTLIAQPLAASRATLLTAIGLAVAIAAVLDLVGIAWNFERSFLTPLRAKGIDLVVVARGSATSSRARSTRSWATSSAPSRACARWPRR